MARARRVASRRAKPGRAKQGPEEANREPVAQTEFEKMQSRLEMAFRRLPIRVALFEGHIPSVVRALILMRPVREIPYAPVIVAPAGPLEALSAGVALGSPTKFVGVPDARGMIVMRHSPEPDAGHVDVMAYPEAHGPRVVSSKVAREELSEIADQVAITFKLLRNMSSTARAALNLGALRQLITSLGIFYTCVGMAEVPESNVPGRPKAEQAIKIAEFVAQQYSMLTGKWATVSTNTDTNEAYGPFLDLLREVFEALGVEASPVNCAKRARAMQLKADRAIVKKPDVNKKSRPKSRD